MNAQHEALKKFGYQIQYAVDRYTAHGLKADSFSNIVIAGMGGSGIGGMIVRSFFMNRMPVPVECVSGYNLPAFVNTNTLVILGSYSGNTEETLSCMEEAKSRGCKMICVSGGGKLEEKAIANQVPLYKVEGGFQPRMALGFSLTYLLLIFGELMGQDLKAELLSASAAVNQYEEYANDATNLFEHIGSRVADKFVVISDAPCEAIALRFAQQIQENAKHECFIHTLPEMNHNVIESYYGKLNSVFFLIDTQQHPRVSARFEFLSGLLEVENNKVVHVTLDEYNIMSMYETIYRLDWLSLFVADHRGVDSLNVPNIMSLKSYLEQVEQ